MAEHVLGVDVGYSLDRRTTGLCLISIETNSVRWQCFNTFTDRERRIHDLKRLIPEGASLLGVGIDGPLVPSLGLTKQYRSADALLSGGIFQKRGKPGQTSSGTGQWLHKHATSLAQLIIEFQGTGHLSVAQATHSDAIDCARIVEAFPTAFLSVLLTDDDFFPAGRMKSDVYWDVAIHRGYLSRLLKHLLPEARLSQRLEDLRDHDHRAAFICALTALSVAKNQFVAVGDTEEGDIMLPASEHWGYNQNEQKWAEVALRANLSKVRANHKFPIHNGSRILRNGASWIP